jgi:2-(1,2-epoxy-1,2-dihydrophenyl)acetyl-CoA isomerase
MALTETSDVHIELDGDVAIIEIRRGPANYFDQALLADIADSATALATDTSCRAIVLCSEGRHFCAGADFAAAPIDDSQAERSRLLYREAARLFDIELPVIAAVQGAAVGGGLGLACSADFRVGGPTSRFAANFARLGFSPGFGLSATLPRIIGHQAAQDMLYSGRWVPSEEAAARGLLDRVVPDDQVREAALLWAHEIARSAPLAVRSIKATLRAGLSRDVRTALDRELAEQARLWDTDDSREGIAASLARREPTFHGS